LETFRAALLPSPEQAAGLPKSPRNPVSKLPEPVTPLRTGVVRAPKPPSEVGGRGTYLGFNPTEVPTDLPPYYPATLEIRTKIILSQAAQKFPKQSHTAEMCRYIVAQLTPYCCMAVVSQAEQPTSVLFGVEQLLRLVRRMNCSTSEILQVEQDTLKSAEWINLVTELDGAKVGETNKKTQTQSDSRALGEGSTEFKPSDDYCFLSYQGEEYALTKTAGKIVKLLHEAHLNGKVGVGSTEIKKRAACGKVWDQFRRRDGQAFWKALIRKTEKDFFYLNLSPVREDEQSPR